MIYLNARLKKRYKNIKMIYDVIIIGGGPAGVTAALYAKRSGLDILLIEKGIIGGKIVNATSLENYPGFVSISGIEFADKLKEQLERLNVNILYDNVIHLNLQEKEKEIKTKNKTFKTKTVILASGTENRKLGIKGEDEFIGRGVSFCATCDAPFFKNKTVAVVGGGNSAVEEALYLSGIASNVYLIHRRDILRAERVRQEKLKEGKVKVLLNMEVEEINGDKFVKSITLRNNKDNRISEINVDGVFISIGYVPSTIIARDAGVNVDKDSYIIVDRYQRTNIDGVFAAGDVTGGIMQVSTAVGEGTVAGISAYNFIKKPYWA